MTPNLPTNMVDLILTNAFIDDPLAQFFVLLKNVETFSIKIFKLGIKVVLNCYILYGIFRFTFYKEDLDLR